MPIEKSYAYFSDKSSFSIKPECPSVLGLKETCKVKVNYLPNKKVGYSDAQLKIPSNGKITPSQYIKLEGYKCSSRLKNLIF
jgi:hypothetical protein